MNVLLTNSQANEIVSSVDARILSVQGPIDSLYELRYMLDSVLSALSGEDIPIPLEKVQGYMQKLNASIQEIKTAAAALEPYTQEGLDKLLSS